ncbi:TPA: CDP-glycerol glycerophosphotransferase family protein [Enterobacter chengduensis]|nr:CDP-glycerol glycerophosphotransferase family protein [Enterobacter chengduensis]
MSANTDHAGRIGFFMETSFHFEVYRSIIFALLEENRPCELLINDLIEEAFVNDMTSYLATLSVPGLGCRLLSGALNTGRRYGCLVSPYYVPGLDALSDNAVRTVYGLAKNDWNHAAWNARYRHILCYSRYTQRALALGEKAKVVGNPRFDDWHNRRYPAELPAHLDGAGGKPVLLYAPTYGELSSLPHWAEKLSRLGSEYHIITKLHHGTLYRPGERASLKLARRFLKRSVQPGDSVFTLLAHADYVISDNSGFIFDAINADKKVILLEWDGMETLLSGNRSFSNPDSPEQQVRQFLPVARDMADLRACLSDDWPWETHAARLQEIKTDYCDAFNDGSAGRRAAEVIMQSMA